MSTQVDGQWRSGAQHAEPQRSELSAAGGFPAKSGGGRGVVDSTDAGEGETGCTARSAVRPAALPCPPNEQLKEKPKEKKGLRSSGCDVGRRFELEVWGAIQKFGADHVAVLTTTPGDIVNGEFVKVQDYAEASRRWNSLNSGALQGRWVQWALVMQRHKDGGIHFHVCVVHREDIRGQIDFAELKRRNYRSVNKALSDEWAFLRDVMPRYGFGPRVEFLPVRDVASLGRYLARYLRREIGTRRKCDRGARLLRYSQSWQRTVRGAFSWCDKRALRAKARGEEIAVRFYHSQEAMERELGRAWKWKLRRLLWCGEAVYHAALAAIVAELECYNGFEFAMCEVLEDGS